MPPIRSVLRALFFGVCSLLLCAGAAYWWFLYAPAPDAPGHEVTRDSLSVGGRMRTFAHFAPSTVRPGAPLLIVLHGSMGSAEGIRRGTGYRFERIAQERGFVVVYPEGFDGYWNDCRRMAPFAAREANVDDVEFMRALVARTQGAHEVDATRVFAVGLSNGGQMAYRLALEAPDLVRGVAAVAASLPTPTNFVCDVAPGTSAVAIMNGTADPISPYDGGRVTLFGFADRGDVVSSAASAAYFARRNGLGTRARSEHIEQEQPARTSAARSTWGAGEAGEVRLYTIRNGGHAFPQPHARAARLLGRTHRQLDGPAEIWSFFEALPVDGGSIVDAYREQP